jgi:hypothetical protein
MMGRVYPCSHGDYLHVCEEQERQANEAIGAAQLAMDLDAELAAADRAATLELARQQADWLTFWTNAPDRYDGFGTTTVETTELYLAGKAAGPYDFPFRRIRCDPAHAQWQCDRNTSGSYQTLTTDQWAEWLLAGRLMHVDPA